MHNNESEKGSTSGCIIWVLILSGIHSFITGILWLIWILGGRPDNWLGKYYRFSLTLSCSIIAIILLCVVSLLCVRIFKAVIKKKK